MPRDTHNVTPTVYLSIHSAQIHTGILQVKVRNLISIPRITSECIRSLTCVIENYANLTYGTQSAKKLHKVDNLISQALLCSILWQLQDELSGYKKYYIFHRVY